MQTWLMAAVACVVALATIRPVQSSSLFSFHSNAWLNLHHFVRMSARGGAAAPTTLPDEENRQWAAAIEFYKPYAARDLLRDDGMVDIKSALRGAEGKTALDAITLDPALKMTLERVMPIYRKRWWPDHERANLAWIAAVQPLLARHGSALRDALTRAYGTRWPSEPVSVDLSVSAGPVGAYTTGPPTHVTISSTDPGYRDRASLEMLFHEASHSDISDLFARVGQAARDQNVAVPPQLWHAVLFYTAGELTRREFNAHGIAYTPYAGEDLYVNLCGAGCRDRIAEHWGPRLDDKRSVADALRALAGSFR